ncbi:hypothetical protein A3D70_00850 [Candidatus Adlerbacteria bacterium RIFCSPHIGHO2_02_FULL_54_18]|uniref:PDZ domain-containing protein n=2 Tax=Candidatus Adleribacteriota TaxID=1752736 RepID=A0A1F4Y1S5_9BACT|nr:MAG: hypothetical protein A2949_01455 [Candidatus Adlerbacteria bacterium RIFCSPLOWO2_01_FULL_54_21b]OGC87927.1 MAG: hypothetical protein A3D70_00850 [Candidatus Adlerbacteria bacterium RIFCSPHIGHO2_02_FULL_54_18]
MILSLIIFIALLVLLILVHEAGHFGAAKLFGIRVDEFAVGFPPRLLTIRRGETEYSINLLLVGGYVKIRGEDLGTDVKDDRSMAARSRPVQAVVVVAGVAVNLLFGWLALSAGYMAGMPTSAEYQGFGTVENIHTTILAVVPGSPAARAGLQPGDTIQSVTTDSAHIAATGSASAQVQEFIAAHQDESFVFVLERGGEEQNSVLRAEEGVIGGRKAIGIQMGDIGILQLLPHLALVEGALAAKDMTVSTATGLGMFFGQLLTGKAQWGDVAGPVGIAGLGAGAVQDGFASAALIVALISINLALINLIPIPGLDGGRLLIIATEGLLRRPISPKIINAFSIAGFALIVVLMVVVTYHDIARLVG